MLRLCCEACSLRGGFGTAIHLKTRPEPDSFGRPLCILCWMRKNFTLHRLFLCFWWPAGTVRLIRTRYLTLLFKWILAGQGQFESPMSLCRRFIQVFEALVENNGKWKSNAPANIDFSRRWYIRKNPICARRLRTHLDIRLAERNRTRIIHLRKHSGKQTHVCNSACQAVLASKDCHPGDVSILIQSTRNKNATCIYLPWKNHGLSQAVYSSVGKSARKLLEHTNKGRPMDFRWATSRGICEIGKGEIKSATNS